MFELKNSNTNELVINNQKITINENIELNKITEKYCLILPKEQVIYLVNNRNIVLKEIGRIEFSSGILEKMMNFLIYFQDYKQQI